jgi:predicted MPP superfamily phosphohydrolase
MNRRDFLQTAALAAAGALAGRLKAQPDPPGAQKMPTLKFAQIADIHMTGFTMQDGQCCPRLPEYAWWAYSRRYDLMGYLLPIALKQIHEQFGAEFVVFTGDQAENGFTKYGKEDLELAKKVAEEHAGVPVHFAYGNHDGPQDKWSAIHGPLDYVFDAGDVRCVVLNTGSMEREKEQESSAKALSVLKEALTDKKARQVLVFAHQWIYPTDAEGYSMARAEEVLAAVEGDPRVVAVINGHYHTGRYNEKSGVHYCTAKALCEPPLSYSTYELTPTELVWTEYKLSAREKAFVVGEERKLKVR